MGKNKIICTLTIILIISIILNCVFYKRYISDLKEGKYANKIVTAQFYDEKKIVYDEEFALKLAAVVFEQLFDKEYSSEDFYIDSGEFGNPCWIITRKEIIDKRNTGDIIKTYDGPQGLYIDKECGAVLAYFEEQLYE